MSTFEECRPFQLNEQSTETKMVFVAGLGPTTCRFVGDRSFLLSYTKLGALGRIRTSNSLIKSQVLYPVELLMRNGRLGGD